MSRLLTARFWGVRGSIPMPAAGYLQYGGNTACVEVAYGDNAPLILDAGTGIHMLGRALVAAPRGNQRAARVFLTHFHWDHIQGLPFFAPLFSADWQLTICAPYGLETLRQAIVHQLQPPYFPAWHAVRAELRFHPLRPEAFQVGDLLVRCFQLTHPDGSVGYRIESPDAHIVYVTDHEHSDSRNHASVIENAAGADVLIYDAQYTPGEYERHKGWGHSTWLEATRVARQAGVKQLILFHHDPQHDDGEISRIAADACGEFSNTVAAAEGWSLSL